MPRAAETLVSDMPPLSFAVTWDYRCPFARNVHEHIVTALEHGADWDVTFVPFSLSQTKVEHGDTDVWDEPSKDSGLLALQVGVVVRDTLPDRFRTFHRDLFALRHDRGGDVRREEVLRALLREHGIDDGAVFDIVGTGSALETIRKEHERAAADHDVWGVPTFIAGDSAAFVRLMNRPGDDPSESISAIQRIVALLGGWPELNELKHTSISR